MVFKQKHDNIVTMNIVLLKEEDEILKKIKERKQVNSKETAIRMLIHQYNRRHKLIEFKED